MNNEKIERRIVDALRKEEPLPPNVHELGGGYYFTCYWLSCEASVHRWMNYCPACGQRIEWEDERGRI